MKMKLTKIKISDSFATTVPSKVKMDECRNNYIKYEKQDRLIVVNKNNELIDGYIMYLAAKELGLNKVDVIVRNKKLARGIHKDTSNWTEPAYRNNMTTYVYGIHPNSDCKKEFVWRVPKKKLADELLPGDMVIAQTKFGYVPVILTKIEWLDKSPIEGIVKVVVKKVNNDSCDYEIAAKEEY